MYCCGFSCCEKNEHVIYLIGQKKHKDLFLENILEIKPENNTYTEFTKDYNGVPLLIQVCDADTKIQELDDLHSKLACGVVYLTEDDRPVNYENFTLFVLMNKTSQQISEDKLTVASVVNNSFAECKEGFKILVSNLKKH